MRPKLVVFRSNKYLYGQVNAAGKTVAAVAKQTDPAVAGRQLAQLAKKAKVTAVTFDRNGYKYHGNVKKFADGAREGGLEF
ncbi:MAG: 50S ribosomal protein L18 [Patescibacteria group bacterium]|nr:50S ribosomal protein L18 [Patescibacteria group bacterium]MCL5432477.1 50S ribosomal protein L18 [Patescibacteria group bacterium]